MSATTRRRIWVLALFAAGALALLSGVHGRGISATRPPPALEERAARAAWRFLVPTHVKQQTNPVATSDAVLSEAAAHWADHCAVCHGSDGSGSTKVSRHMYPPAPDFRASPTQSLTDGEIFYAIEEGIPWTGMPAWTTGTDEGARESWALVCFIRHVPTLTPDEVARIDGLMPKSPADLKQEQDIEEFLRPDHPKARGPGRQGGSPR
jgi:mono/diheme cytochrome c family protein